ncbi:MAG: hypothetical protein QFE16_04580 [Pseudomonadota bacterium]|nr:hypothetical protein [Pseudomonadota bacterium]
MSARSALRAYAEKAPLPAEASFSAAAPRAYLNAVISSSATVGQVNAALTTVGARIVAMQDGSSTVTLELSNAGGPQSAQNVTARLAASRAFEPSQPPAEPIDDHLQPPPTDERRSP